MHIPNTKMWMIRSGRNGTVIHRFLNECAAYLGWGVVGPVHPTDSNASIRRRLDESYPYEKPGALPNIVGMLRRFSCEVRIGETFVTYDPVRRLYHIGVVKSDAECQVVPRVDLATGMEFEVPGYVRDVNWLSATSRDALTRSTQNALNPQLTHYRISAVASAELRRLRP